jgi:hypothetical protein
MTCLHRELKESVNGNPELLHFVIAHSHGGTIALQAVNGSDLQRIFVICLSTPVLHAVLRNPLDEGEGFLWLMASAGIFVGSFVAALLLRYFHFSSRTSDMLGMFSAVCAIGAALIGVLVFQSRAERAMSNSVNVPTANPDRVLFLRYVGDEASFSLTAFQFIQYVVSRIAELLTALFGLVIAIVMACFNIPLIAVVLLYIYASRHSFWGIGDVVLSQSFLPHWTREFIMRIPTFLVHAYELLEKIFIYSFFGLGAASLLSIVLLVCSGIIPFGIRLAFLTIFIEVNVEAVPPGLWRLIMLNPPEQGRALFRHSYSYDESVARESIIREILNKTVPGFVGPINLA